MKKAIKYYIAYGSNLHVGQMHARCPGARPVGTAWLDGWRLAFHGSKTGAYLTIIPDKHARCPVAIWAINADHEAALDRYEGFPTFYQKEAIHLEMKPLRSAKNQKPREVDAMVYIMDPQRVPGYPSAAYIRTCATGYHNFGLPIEYLAAAVDDAWAATHYDYAEEEGVKAG